MLKRIKSTPKNLVAVAALCLCWTLLLGIGSITDNDFPTPEMDFQATITDERGITTTCTSVSWDGEVFFKAKRGEAAITIPFEKVASIERIALNGGGTIDFRITLKSGFDVTVTFDEESRFFGQTNFGTYKIMAKNIREAVFN